MCALTIVGWRKLCFWYLNVKAHYILILWMMNLFASSNPIPLLEAMLKFKRSTNNAYQTWGLTLGLDGRDAFVQNNIIAFSFLIDSIAGLANQLCTTQASFNVNLTSMNC
jgi:hypothetical protein